MGHVAHIRKIRFFLQMFDRFCGLVVTVTGYRSIGPGFDSLPDFLRSSGSGTGSTQPREYNRGAI
jgi:hypothetical protein